MNPIHNEIKEEHKEKSYVKSTWPVWKGTYQGHGECPLIGFCESLTIKPIT